MRLCGILLAAATVALTACATGGDLSGRMAAWQGQPIGVATAAWGPPQAEAEFGDQTLYIWRDVAHGQEGRSELLCERMLAVAADGIVTGWRWRGDVCPALDARPQAFARLDAL